MSILIPSRSRIINNVRNYIEPFGTIKFGYIILISQVILLLSLWTSFASEIMPKPIDVVKAIPKLIISDDFSGDLISSITLTIKGMFYAILISAFVTYLSTIKLFSGLALLISKLRYLTLTGLIYVFTVLSNDVGSLKLYLLLFGIIPFFVTSLMSVIGSINQQEYELCTTLRMNKWETLWEVVIIGRLDQLFEVIRQNFAISWMMITMVEGVAMNEGGIGTGLIKSAKYLNMSDVFAYLTIVLIIGITSDIIIKKSTNFFFPYTSRTEHNN